MTTSIEIKAATTFKFKFFGWLEAEARRWLNPDGTEGGIVALDWDMTGQLGRMSGEREEAITGTRDRFSLPCHLSGRSHRLRRTR